MTAISWKSGVSGNWTTAADWTPGQVPGVNDDVTIADAGTYTVTLTGSQKAHSVTLNASGAKLTDTGTLTLGTTLALDAGTFTLGSGGVLAGGTVDMLGGSFVASGGTLSGVRAGR